MAEQVGHTGFERFGVGLGIGALGGPAVMLERAHRGHQHDHVGPQAVHAALDVQELLRAQVRAEARLRHRIVGHAQRQPGRGHAVAAVRDVGKRPAVHQAGGMADGLDEVGAERVAQKRGHRARRAHLARRDRRALIRARDHDAAQPGLEVPEVGGQAEGGHHLAGGGDVKAVLARRAVLRAAQALHDMAQLPVVDVQAMAEAHPPGIDAQGVALLDMVVHHGAQQVVGSGDGVQVAGEVQVDALHGHHLGPAAACRAALHAKHRPKRRFAQGQHGVFADAAHAVGQSDGYGGLALARRGGVDGRHQHQLCALRQVRVGALVNLGYIPPIGRNGLRQKARVPGDVFNGFQRCFPRDFQIRRHVMHAPFCSPKL